MSQKVPVLFKFSIVLFFSFLSLYSQKVEYGWPVKGNQIITGSFGEFRYYYFHLGMDFATGGKVNTPIMAISDGEVVKIMSNRYSIGNAIFLKHKDGLTSKYGHLNQFTNKLLESLPDNIKDKIIQRQDFEYDLEKPVAFFKGDEIALSGDTGIGPAHLHLEIFKDDTYYNPALFGLNYNPKGHITLFSLFIKPHDHKSFINGKNESIYIPLIQTSKALFIPNLQAPIKIQGKVFFQIEGNELSGPVNKLGFQKLGIQLNREIIQEINFDSIKRSHILRSCLVMDNYRSKMNGKPFSYYLYTRYENGLLGYKNKSKGKGIISDSDLLHEVENEVLLTAEGLSSTAVAKVYLIRDYADYSPNIVKPEEENVTPEKYTTVSSEDKTVELYFPANSVFSPANFSIEKTNIKVQTPDIKVLSDVYTILPDYREFHLGYDLFFKARFDEELSKVNLYKVSDKGRVLGVLNSNYVSNKHFFTKRRIRTVGNFVVLADYSKPTIHIHKYTSGQVFKDTSFSLNFVIKDTGIGVGHEGLRVKIDSEEAMVDYDPESGFRNVFAPTQKIYAEGKHKITAIATDGAGNVSEPFEFEYEIK
jgi:hypothetical protein